MVVEGFDVDAANTKGLIAKLKDLDVGQRPLIVTEEASEHLYLSARNLRYVEVRDVQGLDPVALVGADYGRDDVRCGEEDRGVAGMSKSVENMSVESIAKLYNVIRAPRVSEKDRAPAGSLQPVRI